MNKMEERCAADALRHAEEFRRKHRVSLEEWQRAEACYAAWVKELHDSFWRLMAHS